MSERIVSLYGRMKGIDLQGYMYMWCFHDRFFFFFFLSPSFFCSAPFDTITALVGWATPNRPLPKLTPSGGEN